MTSTLHPPLTHGIKSALCATLALLFASTACSLLGQTPYYLTIEESPAVGTGGTVHRFYVNAVNETDKMSAVYGNDVDHLMVSTPSGIFNSGFNSSWNASGINPAFLPVFPELADDSYATIGLTGPASSSGLTGAADPSLVEDVSLNPSVSEYFQNGGLSLDVSTLTGASWYVLNTAANALPIDGRWLIMQITTIGEVSGVLNYQIFPLGIGDDAITVSVPFEGVGDFGLNAAEGCLDASACNFDESAVVDDGSCEYTTCAGCMDSQACNFDDQATINFNDSCVYCDCGTSGSGYLLVVSEEPAAVVPGSKRFRFSVRMVNGGDRMSAIFGNSEVPLDVSVSSGAFNSPYNTGWNAAGVNPAFLGAFPELIDDTYATIGLDGPASVSELANAADPLLAEDSNQPITPFFLVSGATQLLSDQIIGSSWFTLSDVDNSLPDENLEVLILQVTTSGTVEGLVNVSILPEGTSGIGSNITRTFSFSGAGTYGALDGGNSCGCTDEAACNFDPNAEYDDGSCLAFDECGICGGAGIADGACDCNGNQIDALGVCGGACAADIDGDGVCDDEDDCAGELDECGICNGPGAIYECGCSDIPEGDCDCEGNQATEFVDCDGNCLQDVDADGICDDVDECVDTEAPVWAYFPPNDTIACDEMMPTVEETAPVASDDCGPVDVIWVGDGPFDYPFGCLQSYTCPRVYQAIDAAGNSIVDTLIITVLDTVAPILAYPTEPVVLVNELEGDVLPSLEAFVIDNCDTNADYEVTESVLGEEDGVLTLERVYTASDACGNTTVFVQTITVTLAFEGCMDDTACNYDAGANVDDGSCDYPQEHYDCEGVCLNDGDGDGVCDELEVEGCTDDTACNFDAEATEEDGSCEYCSCAGDEFGGYGILVEEHAVHEDGILAGMTTYRMYVQGNNPGDTFSAMYGDAESPLVISSSTSFYQHEFGSHSANNNNPLLFDAFPELEFDSWLTVGIDGPAAAGEQSPSFLDEGYWIPNFEAGLDVHINDTIGGIMYVVNDQNPNTLVGEDLLILIGQFTTDGELSASINLQMFNNGVGEDAAEIVGLEVDGVGLHTGGGDVVCGCMDETACNYDENANNDDGSCEFESCLGCTDDTACNYDADATVDDDSCTYPEYGCFDCEGNCLVDEDQDGVCDCIEFPGCTDPEACNYDPIYTDDAGNCYYAEEFFDCNGNCLNDTDGDGTCDELEVFGCTDETFCNFNPEATEDDGSCGEADVPNDVCEGALTLTCGETYLVNNEECATVDEVQGCADATPADPTAGLWFSFIGTGNEMTVSTCYQGTTIDTYLSVYEGVCGDLSCVAGNDDQSEPFYNDLCPVTFVASTVAMNTVEGQEYFVLAMGVFGEEGDFEVGLSCVLEGCTDVTACNYDPEANSDDGSCTYPEEDYLDCDGNCVNDADADGVCDELEVEGCTDEAASNYNELATDEDGSCQYCDLVLDTELVQALTCADGSDALVELILEGVTAPDSIEVYLDGALQDTTLFEGLSAGTYTVEVLQGVDCSALVNFTVDGGLTLEVSASVLDVACAGESSGQIEVLVANGVGPFEYVLDGPVVAINDTGVFTELPEGRTWSLSATPMVAQETFR